MPHPSDSKDLRASTPSESRWTAVAVCVLLAALVWTVFGQSLGFEFVNFDDPANVAKNPAVAKGLTVESFVSSFTHTQVGHWNPLTTLSHMLVSQFCGVNPGGHHLGNVLIHGAAAILLFLVLWRMTSFLWRSAFVAAVFAIHPLRVESVAWVTERKDVLSGVFFMLTLAAYVGYVRAPQSPARYVSVAVLFVLGLMSKSMLVTLPFVLLLLDYWPLGRFERASSGQGFLPTFRALLREKIPLLALSGLFAIIQIIANREGIVDSEKMPLAMRMGNAIASYADYIGQMFYPARLAVFYPHPEGSLPAWKLALALAVLAAISSAAFGLRKRHPYLITGWLWYLAMLVPVIGLVQSGDLARADRYTYLPQIGLYLMVTWMAADLCARFRQRAVLLGAASALVIAALTFSAHRQAAHWRDSETLWRHALAVDDSNPVAHEYLALAFDLQNRDAEAVAHHQRAIALKPDYALARNNLAPQLLANGQVEEAITHLEEALKARPLYAAAHNNLGNAFLQTGRFEEAIIQYRRAIEIRADFSAAEANLGLALLQTGRVANAIMHLERAIAIQPDYAKAHANLGSALLRSGRAREAVERLQTAIAYQPDDAISHANLGRALLLVASARDAIPHFRRALELHPRFTASAAELAWILATTPDSELRDGSQAVILAERANELASGRDASILRTLAAAYAEAGRFADAIKTAESAMDTAKAQPNKALIEALQTEIQLYRSGSALRMAQGGN